MSCPQPYNGNENYIFASYSFKDREKVFSVVSEMQKKGYRIRFAESLDNDDEWNELCENGIKECRLFIAFITENYLLSNRCGEEVKYAGEKEKIRVGVQLETVDLSSSDALPDSFATQLSKGEHSNTGYFDVSASGTATTAVATVCDSGRIKKSSGEDNSDVAHPAAVQVVTDKAPASKSESVDGTFVLQDSENDKAVSKNEAAGAADNRGNNKQENWNGLFEYLIDIDDYSRKKLFIKLERIIDEIDRKNGYALISYRSTRPAEAAFVRNLLKKNGVKYWMAPESIPTGKEYPDVITDGIAGCRGFVLVYTRQVYESIHVKTELALAFGKKPIFALEFDTGLQEKNFDYFLALAQREHVSEMTEQDAGVTKFLSSVIGCAGQSLMVRDTGVCGQTTDITETDTIPVTDLMIEEMAAAYDSVIPDYSFKDRADIVEITIPDNVKKIGKGAFQGCKRLKKIYISDSVTEIGAFAFADCTALVDVRLSNNLKTIGNDAFRAVAIENVAIPESVSRIGESAFQGCTQIKTVSISDKLSGNVTIAFPDVALSAFVFRKSIAVNETLLEQLRRKLRGSSATDDSQPAVQKTTGTVITKPYTLHIPAGTTVVEKEAYKNRTDITEVVFPDGLTEIGMSAFAGCVNLKSVVLPDGLHTIGRNAFKDCSGLNHVEFPDSLKVIHAWAFRECVALSEIALPDTVEHLGEMAFAGCESLIDVHIPTAIKHLAHSVFASCSSLVKIEIPDSITEVGDFAFRDCMSLTDIVWTENLTKIGKYAFKGCAALKTLCLPETVTTVSGCAFSGCSAINTLYLPQALTAVGNWAFKDCDALQFVILSKQVYSERFRLFDNIPKSVFRISDGTGFAGKNTQLMKAADYYYARNGQSYGPYTYDAVVQLIQNNVVDRSTYLWKRNMKNWEAAYTFAEFANMFAPIPAVPSA